MTADELIALYEARICPCCGATLDFEPWSSAGRFQSDEICPCCAVQFGYTDQTSPKDIISRIEIYTSIRKEWIAAGMVWKHAYRKPEPWDPVMQLKQIEKTA